MNAFPQHSKAPWVDNEGSIETTDGAAVCYVVQAGELPFLSAEAFARVEVECRANTNVIRYAPALLANLRYALWCFLNGIAPTADAIANMLSAAALASGEDVVTFGPRVGAEGGAA